MIDIDRLPFCDKVKAALSAFTPDERSHLVAVLEERCNQDGQCAEFFVGICYVGDLTGSDPVYVKFTDEEKLEAIRVLDEHYRLEERCIRIERAKRITEELMEGLRKNHE